MKGRELAGEKDGGEAESAPLWIRLFVSTLQLQVTESPIQLLKQIGYMSHMVCSQGYLYLFEQA